MNVHVCKYMMAHMRFICKGNNISICSKNIENDQIFNMIQYLNETIFASLHHDVVYYY